QTFTAGYNGMVSDKIGLGAMVISDNLGSLNKTSGVLSYSYQFDIEETRLSIGLSTGYERYKLQASALLGNGLDPGDPIIDQAANGYDVFDAAFGVHAKLPDGFLDRKSTRLNSSHVKISYAVFCLKKKKINTHN